MYNAIDPISNPAIYQLSFPDGCIYIGRTKNYAQRMDRWEQTFQRNKQPKSMKQYTWDEVTPICLVYVKGEDLAVVEAMLIRDCAYYYGLDKLLNTDGVWRE
jgi:hypothetical protein